MDFAVRHTHFCQWTPFFHEGDTITETFKSVDLDFIVSELNDSVLYW